MHLAQLNVGRLVAPLTSPQIADFVAALDPINAVADAAPGFVWRLQTDEGDATSVRMFDDDLMIVNMSVWESREALVAFVYQSEHVAVMRRRREWFERMAEAFQALWWVPIGTTPTVVDAKARLVHLRAYGPSATAFTFADWHDPPKDDARTADDTAPGVH